MTRRVVRNKKGPAVQILFLTLIDIGRVTDLNCCIIDGKYDYKLYLNTTGR
jgi:hypothetical protein